MSIMLQSPSPCYSGGDPSFMFAKPIKVRLAASTPASGIRGSALSPAERKDLQMRTIYPIIVPPTGCSIFSNEFICNLISSMPCNSLLNVYNRLDVKLSITVDRPKHHDLSNTCVGRLELISYDHQWCSSPISCRLRGLSLPQVVRFLHNNLLKNNL